MAKSNRNRNAEATDAPATEQAPQENTVITLSLVKLYDNGKATYTADGLKGRIRFSPTMFAVKGTVPNTITLSAEGLATASPEEAAKAKERAEKRAARKAKSAETAAQRLAKAEEKARKANERLEKLRNAGKPKDAPATDAPATDGPFEDAPAAE
jgi:hypothetical protein